MTRLGTGSGEQPSSRWNLHTDHRSDRRRRKPSGLRRWVWTESPGNTVRVLAGRCSHLSGPLLDGDLCDVGGVDCIECPWHHSTFRLDDSTVMHGPATSPQPAFATRVEHDQVEITLPGAG